MKTWKNFKEVKQHGNELFHLETYRSELKETNFDLYLHWHDEIEILTVEQGECSINIKQEQHVLKQGDFVFLNRGELHSARAIEESDCVLRAVVFSPDIVQFSQMDQSSFRYIKPIIEQKIVFSSVISADEPITRQLHDGFYRILDLYDKKDTCYELMIKAELLLIISLMFRESLVHDSKKFGLERGDWLREVIGYIDGNISERLSVKELAKVAGYSEHHFIRSFKGAVGMSVTEYINDCRIQKGAALVRSTSLNISEIAVQVGYSHVSYFIQQFKKRYGQTPFKYRNNS